MSAVDVDSNDVPLELDTITILMSVETTDLGLGAHVDSQRKDEFPASAQGSCAVRIHKVNADVIRLKFLGEEPHVRALLETVSKTIAVTGSVQVKSMVKLFEEVSERIRSSLSNVVVEALRHPERSRRHLAPEMIPLIVLVLLRGCLIRLGALPMLKLADGGPNPNLARLTWNIITRGPRRTHT